MKKIKANKINYKTSVFDFNVEIRVGVAFDPDDLGILGSAGPEDWDYSYSSNYLTYSDTWYPQALSNQLFGYDREPSNNDISININSSVTDCAYPSENIPYVSFSEVIKDPTFTLLFP